MKINIPVEIYETDYILFDIVEKKPVEGFDTIYSAESVIDCFNYSFHLEPNEKFVKMTDLPKDVLLNYAKRLTSNQTKF